MTEALECPHCAERESLRGEADGGGVRVHCQSCGATWMRGAPKCRKCGDGYFVTRPQHLARTPCGNQVAVVGQREVTLCPRCDVDVIDPDNRPNSPSPEGYVSRFMFGEPQSTPPGELAAPHGPRAHRRPNLPAVDHEASSGSEEPCDRQSLRRQP